MAEIVLLVERKRKLPFEVLSNLHVFSTPEYKKVFF
jgi:hypothetical protein